MKKEVEKLLQYVQKPARYIGGELNAVVKDKEKVDIRYAFCFPDTYEIGMSHLGMKILYGLVNDRDDSWCERVFAPDNDMEEQLRKNNVPLFALESGDYIKDFDMIGFTLQYELSYTNILNMLNLAQIPLKSSDRESLTPLICVGGPCACNPEPITDFVDIVFLGDGEDDFDMVLNAYPHIKYERVCGNCDWGSNYPDKMEIEFAGKKIFFSHGHPYNVKFAYENIIAEAKKRGADIVLFGHTHNQYTEYQESLCIMNPGSVANGDYGVIDITPKGDIMLIKENI